MRTTLVALKKTLANEIMSLAGSGVADFYTGGAVGVDCWAALTVLDLRKKIPR